MTNILVRIVPAASVADGQTFGLQNMEVINVVYRASNDSFYVILRA